MIDKIKLDENNRCVSANCVYEDTDTVIEREFEDEEERMNFFCNIQDYVYKDGEFIHDPLPQVQAKPSEQDLINADLYLQIAQLQTNGISFMSLSDEKSKRYDIIQKYYDLKIYDEQNLELFVAISWITEEEKQQMKKM